MTTLEDVHLSRNPNDYPRSSIEPVTEVLIGGKPLSECYEDEIEDEIRRLHRKLRRYDSYSDRVERDKDKARVRESQIGDKLYRLANRGLWARIWNKGVDDADRRGY